MKKIIILSISFFTIFISSAQSTYNYKGVIGDLKVIMSITLTDEYNNKNEFTGTSYDGYYYYEKEGKILKLNGHISMYIVESAANGLTLLETYNNISTGYWNCAILPGENSPTITGTWSSPDGKKTYAFYLTKQE